MGAPIRETLGNLQVHSDSDEDVPSFDPEPRINWEERYQQRQRERLRREGLQVGSPFPHPWWSAYSYIGPSSRCLDEWLVMEISSSIRGKPDWKRKYKDEEIVKKWKSEIRESCKDRTKLIEEVIGYVFKELEWCEELETCWMGDSGFEIGFNEYISTSDKSVASEVKESLKKEVSRLVEAFGDSLDYHPGSDEKVIDLVHPSLFPLQYDITPIVNDNNSVAIVKYKEEIECAKKEVDSYGVSKRFQWLPSLLKVEEERLKFSSYINNLHPVKYKELYGVIENVFNSVIPGLNYTLIRYASKECIRIKIPPGDEVYSEEYHNKLNELYEKYGDDVDQMEVENQIEELQNNKENYLLLDKIKWEEPPEFDHIIDVKSFENLKVVVKLANIELTPEKPSYAGGSWHVEGTINEDIIATVLYYYDMDNISESKLSFRTAFEDPSYDQGDSFYTKYFYGFDDEDLMVKNIGSVEAKEDRIVIFPNMYQHHVDPFELKDKTKPGYRKILCFFICDPYNTNVVATDKVPPQQEDWWNDPELNYLYPGNIKEQILQLKEDDPWPMNLQEAKSVRRELMDERTAARPDDEDEAAFERHFSLCEH